MATQKGTIESATLPQCGKALPYKKQKKDLHWAVFSGHERRIAIRTHLLVMICINSGPGIAKKNHELQQGDCTKMCKKSLGRTKKTKIRSSKRTLSQEPSPRKESVIKKESSRVDPGASMHMMTKSDLIHEEKQQVCNRKNQCTIITANGSEFPCLRQVYG